MHFHNLGIANLEGEVEEDIQRDLAAEFDKSLDAEAANNSSDQGKHHSIKNFNSRHCYATSLLFIFVSQKVVYTSRWSLLCWDRSGEMHV